MEYSIRTLMVIVVVLIGILILLGLFMGWFKGIDVLVGGIVDWLKSSGPQVNLPEG